MHSAIYVLKSILNSSMELMVKLIITRIHCRYTVHKSLSKHVEAESKPWKRALIAEFAPLTAHNVAEPYGMRLAFRQKTLLRLLHAFVHQLPVPRPIAESRWSPAHSYLSFVSFIFQGQRYVQRE